MCAFQTSFPILSRTHPFAVLFYYNMDLLRWWNKYIGQVSLIRNRNFALTSKCSYLQVSSRNSKVDWSICTYQTNRLLSCLLSRTLKDISFSSWKGIADLLSTAGRITKWKKKKHPEMEAKMWAIITRHLTVSLYTAVPTPRKKIGEGVQ